MNSIRVHPRHLPVRARTQTGPCQKSLCPYLAVCQTRQPRDLLNGVNNVPLYCQLTERIESFRDLRVYQAAFELQQEVFKVSKAFPKEEMFSLTDQIRRSSRAIGANLAEAWQKLAKKAL